MEGRGKFMKGYHLDARDGPRALIIRDMYTSSKASTGLMSNF